VEKFLGRGDKKIGEVNLSFLKDHGFIKRD
jgi:hypothetical protein